MNFVCSKSDIQKALSHAESIVSTRTTLSILSNVLIETKDNSIELSSTDLEVGYRTSIPSEINISGSITIQAKKLSEIIKSFPGGNLQFSMDPNNRVTIKTEDPNFKANFKIVGIPKDDYPKIPTFIEQNVLMMDQSLLKHLIKKTIFSASTDEARYFLNGLYFEKKNENLNVVATDGKRLSYISTDLGETEIGDFDVIIPSKVLNELIKVLGDNGPCHISLTESKVFFKMEDTELVSNLLEGQFPNYEQVIPTGAHNIMTLENIELSDAVKRVSHMVDPKLAQMVLDVEPGKLTLKGNHPDLGEAKDELQVEYDGDELTVAFNYHYLLDALKEIDHKQVRFEMSDNKSPVIVRGTDDENYFSVVMPMKLTEE